MNNKLLHTFCLLFIFPIFLSAQRAKDVFPLSREFKKGGFYISPQATYSIGNNAEGKYTIIDTSYNYDVEGRGKLGYGLEIGWFHSFKEPRLIHYLEAGIAYRVFKGEADHEGQLTTPLSINTFQSENNFNNQYLVASIRAANAKQLGEKSFLSTALGVNFNYQLSENYERENFYPFSNEEEFLKEYSLQIHLQLGVGFRVSRQLIIMPTIETPLLTAYPTDNLNPAFPFFNARYQPLIVGLRFMFLREDPVNCNAPVYEGVPQ